MKRLFIFCSLILCFLWAKADMYDQHYFGNATTIRLEKPGTLSKVIGKDINNITVLQIHGQLSDKDMKTLSKLTNLLKLSLRYSVIEETKSFPVLPNLEVLFLPQDQHLPVEYMNLVPANQKLKVLLFCSFLDIQPRGSHNGGSPIRFAPFASLEKVIITDLLEEQNTIDYQKNGVAQYTGIPVDTVIYLCRRPVVGGRPITQQFSAKNYEEENGHLFYVGNQDIDLSTVQAVKEISSNNNIHIPSVLDLRAMTYIEEGFFNKTDVEEIVFSADSELEIMSKAFSGAHKLKKIVFSNSLKNVRIHSEAFANCPSLETVVFECPVTIGWRAFYNYKNLKEVIFNQSADISKLAFDAETEFGYTPSIKKVIFNGEATIDYHGLPYVDEIIFNTIPSKLKPDFSFCKNIQVPTIEGAYEKFLSWDIKREYLINPLANLTLDIVVTEPGNILKYLPIDKLSQIKSLTITGHLYDTDIAIIKQCVNLQYLDLLNTYISESPTTQERRQAENDMWAAIAELSVADAQIKQATGEYKKREAKVAATEAVLAAAMMQANNPDMPDCYIPASAFENMRLVEVTLPKMVRKIQGAAFRGCKSLEKVYLGEVLETIGRYAFAETMLSEINFPSSLKKIYGDAFDQIKTLKVIDLSACYMDHFTDYIGGAEVNAHIGCMPNIETVYMPNGMTTFNAFVNKNCSGLKNVYVGKDVKVMNASLDNVNLYFQSEMAPELNSFSFSEKIKNCTIYIPKDANITSYYAKFNDNGNKIIQEK